MRGGARLESRFPCLFPFFLPALQIFSIPSIFAFWSRSVIRWLSQTELDRIQSPFLPPEFIHEGGVFLERPMD